MDTLAESNPDVNMYVDTLLKSVPKNIQSVLLDKIEENDKAHKSIIEIQKNLNPTVTIEFKSLKSFKSVFEAIESYITKLRALSANYNSS